MKRIQFVLKTSILIVILGVILGILSTSTINKSDIIFEYNDKNKVMIFINNFCYNYFYLFIIWLLGFINVGIIFTIFITFFKSFIEGVGFAIIIKTYSLYGVIEFLKLKIFELIFIIPVLIFISYSSISKSINNNNLNNNQDYIKKLFIMTFVIVIYAIFKSLL